MVDLLSTLLVSAPNAASAAPPPSAEPMPPSFDFCIRTTRMRKSETRMRKPVRRVRRRLMTKGKGSKKPSPRRNVNTSRLFSQAVETRRPSGLDAQFLEQPLQVFVAAVLDHDAAFFRGV